MWHFQQGGEAKGPYTDEQLKALCEARVVHAGTMVWRSDFANWRPLAETDFRYRSVLNAPPVGQAGGLHGTGGSLSLWGNFVKCLTTHYATFTGRADRREFWSFVLFYLLFVIVLACVGAFLDVAVGNIGGSGSNNKAILTIVMMALFVLATLIPNYAVSVRRLHDGGFSGWLVLIGFIPYVGAIAMLVFMLLPGEPVANKHGAPLH